MRAIRKDGIEVKSGDIIEDFRGGKWKFLGIVEGHKIHVEDIENSSWHQVFFSTVFDLEVVE
jgi:hypothetical protein